MTLRTIVVLVMSIVCGTSAAVGVNVLLGRNTTEPVEREVVRTTSIVVAAVDIPRGTLLKPEFLKNQDWPESLLPKGSIQDLEKIEDRATLAAIVVGEPLLESKLSVSGTGGIAAFIHPGMRAYTIAVPSVSAGVAGMVQPGNHVDILLTVRDAKVPGGGGTWALLQNIEILAADQRLEQNDANKPGQLRSVTLHVTPDMATKLTLAQTMGALNLTLRHATDKLVAETRPVTMADLHFLQEFLRDGIQNDQEADSAKPAGNALAPVREILTLRGNSAALVRVSASSMNSRYSNDALAEE